MISHSRTASWDDCLDLQSDTSYFLNCAKLGLMGCVGLEIACLKKVRIVLQSRENDGVGKIVEIGKRGKKGK